MTFKQYPPEDSAPPSTYAIASFIDGEPGSLGRVLLLTAARSIPVGVGLALAGRRERIVRDSLIVSGTITGSMLLLMLLQKRRP